MQRQLLDLGHDETVAIRAKFDGLATALAETVADKTVSAAQAWVKSVTAPGMPAQKSGDAGDTPGVRIQDAVATYASEQRLWVVSCYGQLEAQFLSGQVTRKQLGELLAVEEITDVAALRRTYMRFFESAIWAEIFRFGRKGGAKVVPRAPCWVDQRLRRS